jgi:DNA segregation ATPase FtsK/SpoIIIE-like protein
VSPGLTFSALPGPLLRGFALVGAGLVGVSFLLSALSGSGRRPRRVGPSDDGAPAPEYPPDSPPSAGAASARTRRRAAPASRTATRPPRAGPLLGGWMPLLCADAAAIACLRLGLGPAPARLLAAWGLGAEALTLAAFVPWAARHRAWHLADYAHFLTLLPGALAALLQGRRADAHGAAFAAGAARRRADREAHARAALAAWRVDQALRRHSAGYAASGAAVEAAPGDDGSVTELRLRFPGGIPDAAAEAAFREHAASGLLARAAGTSADRATLVETETGLLVLRIGRPTSPAAETPILPLPPSDDGHDGDQRTADTESPYGANLPPLSLLAPPSTAQDQTQDRRALSQVAERSIETLARLTGVPLTYVRHRVGAAVLQVLCRYGEGVKASRILPAAVDLAAAIGIPSVRIAPAFEEGTGNLLAIEIGFLGPLARFARTVAARDLYGRARDLAGLLPFIVGEGLSGSPVVADICACPHLLVAGVTNGGKSVWLHSLLVQLLLRNSPAALSLVLIDPKAVELTSYEGLPHLRYPVVTDAVKASSVLESVVQEMERRYDLLRSARVRNLAEYNRAAGEHGLPYIVVVIDEFADLKAQMTSSDDQGANLEIFVQRMAQKARAAGIHLVLATQKVVREAISTMITANVPARIVLRTSNEHESRLVIDAQGAERLRGYGDLLWRSADGTVIRAQSPFVSASDVEAVVRWWRSQGEQGKSIVEVDESREREEARRAMEAVIAAILPHAEALQMARVAFVRTGDFIAIQKEHLERLLSEQGRRPEAILPLWRAAGWIRCEDERFTLQVRAPWDARTRMVVIPQGAMGGEPARGSGEGTSLSVTEGA